MAPQTPRSQSEINIVHNIVLLVGLCVKMVLID